MITVKGLQKLIANPSQFMKDFIKKYIYKNQNNKRIDFTKINPLNSYTHLLHSGENITGESHLDLWIPHFIASDVKFLILVRNQLLFEKMIEKYPLLDIAYAKENGDIVKLFNQLPYLKACFYPSNTGNNLHLLQFNELKHIFIGHGDSDKTASAHKYFRVYDENWVAGEAHSDRFTNAGFDSSGLEHVRVGRPNLLDTLKMSEIDWRERFNGELNLLYLSTWEGVYQEQNYTSVYIINKLFLKLENYKFKNINIKLHPRVATRDESLKDIDKVFKSTLSKQPIDFEIHAKEMPVEELIKKSNIFICDISAVVSECLSANAPIFVYIPKDKEIKLSRSKMDYEYYTYTFSTIDELLEKLNEVIIKGNDSLAEKREEAMEYILGKDETLTNTFIRKLQLLEDK